EGVRLTDLVARPSSSPDRPIRLSRLFGTWDACCARAASGHATAAPPSSMMNARRLTRRRWPGAQTFGVVHILVPREATKYRLSGKRGQCVPHLLARDSVCQII